MTELESDEFYEAHAEYCGICANANRLKVLDLLKSGDSYSVSTIEEKTGIPQSTLSQHLKVMRDQGMLTRERDGVRNFYSIADDRIVDGIEVIQGVIRDQLNE
ncbi:ArsR/SmtB family transcription factor [Halodesulfurarchaeum formicicum]|uniref:ArsR family transcriptional regulator n=1 Tax=Halodesulfurarchaeum formicicum TaxID=1873524 RepID=A0A1J1AD48_9EURY|nr:metalloregulator ArsR/SmtB family transcription factor [Halodesulfurarchaeum formicicum]APE96076.1 ArsR family transcriptional regulator [Halodesulfurarchaeum formicicum]